MSKKVKISVFLFSAIFLWGCGQSAAPKKQAPKKPKIVISDGNSKSGKSVSVDVAGIDSAKLHEKISENQGKVVVVYVWGTWNIPSKNMFSGLVDLDKKYAGNEVVCISLAVPQFAEPVDTMKAKAFLKEKKAAFANYYWDSNQDYLEEFDFIGPPAVMVFNTENKLVGPDAKLIKSSTKKMTFDNTLDFEFGDVEGLVKKILEK